jgi:hypothetical protein
MMMVHQPPKNRQAQVKHVEPEQVKQVEGDLGHLGSR